jgi:phosphatidylinositol 3-kinase
MFTFHLFSTSCIQHFHQEILNYAPSQPLNSEEKDLIWKFRFYLVRDKRGLTKFLKSVTWRDSSEVKQAVEELLPQWTEIDTDDALELLGPGTVDSRVRAFAVRQLSRADDDVFDFILASNQFSDFHCPGATVVSPAIGPGPQV